MPKADMQAPEITPRQKGARTGWLLIADGRRLTGDHERLIADT
ncbi:MAG TPA: hypothetical protein PKY77_01385 [Phycisphaerae bacterium]|nr:hypothetical protein [Phycisphaerae bacterium]HRY68063.1 hypothetical protein [Phycisphaerae bacterium]HSA28657.1 hypothetical protein [Phycisphaerae bacterium]